MSRTHSKQPSQHSHAPLPAPSRSSRGAAQHCLVHCTGGHSLVPLHRRGVASRTAGRGRGEMGDEACLLIFQDCTLKLRDSVERHHCHLITERSYLSAPPLPPPLQCPAGSAGTRGSLAPILNRSHSCTSRAPSTTSPPLLLPGHNSHTHPMMNRIGRPGSLPAAAVCSTRATCLSWQPRFCRYRLMRHLERWVSRTKHCCNLTHCSFKQRR